jgi:hypothetical protein
VASLKDHKLAVQCLIDVTEAMLHAMEKSKIDPETVTKRPEFAVLIHFIKSIIDGELDVPNHLTQTIKDKAEELDLEVIMNRKLH